MKKNTDKHKNVDIGERENTEVGTVQPLSRDHSKVGRRSLRKTS